MEKILLLSLIGKRRESFSIITKQIVLESNQVHLVEHISPIVMRVVLKSIIPSGT